MKFSIANLLLVVGLVCNEFAGHVGADEIALVWSAVDEIVLLGRGGVHAASVASFGLVFDESAHFVSLTLGENTEIHRAFRESIGSGSFVKKSCALILLGIRSRFLIAFLSCESVMDFFSYGIVVELFSFGFGGTSPVDSGCSWLQRVPPFWALPVELSRVVLGIAGLDAIGEPEPQQPVPRLDALGAFNTLVRLWLRVFQVLLEIRGQVASFEYAK